MGQVLIVDPNQEDASALTELISPHCDAIRCARTTDEAVAILDNNDLDVVVTEIFLDHMDGLEFIRRVKSNSPRTKVISLTSGPRFYKHRAAGDLSYFLRAAHVSGADFVLKKERMTECVGCIASFGFFGLPTEVAAHVQART